MRLGFPHRSLVGLHSSLSADKLARRASRSDENCSSGGAKTKRPNHKQGLPPNAARGPKQRAVLFCTVPAAFRPSSRPGPATGHAKYDDGEIRATHTAFHWGKRITANLVRVLWRPQLVPRPRRLVSNVIPPWHMCISSPISCTREREREREDRPGYSSPFISPEN
jgi:hypothetical protein